MCPDKTYVNKEAKECTPCHSTCLACSGPGDKDCLDCDPIIGYLLNGVCTPCPAGKYGKN